MERSNFQADDGLPMLLPWSKIHLLPRNRGYCIDETLRQRSGRVEDWVRRETVRNGRPDRQTMGHTAQITEGPETNNAVRQEEIRRNRVYETKNSLTVSSRAGPIIRFSCLSIRRRVLAPIWHSLQGRASSDPASSRVLLPSPFQATTSSRSLVTPERT